MLARVDEADRTEGGPNRRTVLGLTAAVAVLLVLDLVIAVQASVLPRAVLPLGLTAVAAVSLWSRHRLATAIGLAGVSVAASLAARAARSTTVQSAVPEGPWTELWSLFTSNVPIFAEIIGLVVLCSLTAWSSSPRRRALTAGAALAAFVAMVSLRWDSESDDVLLVSLLFVLAAGVGAGLWLRAIDLKRVAAEDSARQEERLALARDLHDLVAHHMTGIALHSQAAQMVLLDDPELARRSLAEIEQSVRAALTSVRSVVSTLREPAAYLPTASIDDIAGLATAPDAPGLAVRVEIDPAFERLDGAAVATAHRITLEALSNARRHADGATGARARLHVDGDEAVVEVVNNGAHVPASSTSRHGYGLIGVDERVAALGGTLRFGPRTGGGWALVARFPAATSITTPPAATAPLSHTR